MESTAGAVVAPLASTIVARRNRILITTVSLALVLSALILLVVRRSVSRPIRNLIARARDIGRGRWAPPIEASGNDEISALAREFTRMSESLQDTSARLVQEQQEKLKLERNLRPSENLPSFGLRASLRLPLQR